MRPRGAVLLVLICVALLPFAEAVFKSVASQPVAAQVTPLGDDPDEEAPNLGRITGTPDPGPAPEDAGDRGGLIQLGLAAILFGGLVFIATRVSKEVRRNRGRDPRTRGGPS